MFVHDVKWKLAGISILTVLLLSGCASSASSEWKLAFSDSGSEKWQEGWFLEGAKASVVNGETGMTFSSGPVPLEQASHAVLWTKQSFSGDIKIEYDYTRLDSMTNETAVNILYVQATGLGAEELPNDIFKSTQQREVPWMKSYFLNMNTLHISYSTTGPKRSHYVAARRYPAADLTHFQKETQIQPIYENIDLFQPSETCHITAVKEGRRLVFSAERDGKIHSFDWDCSSFPPVTEGRIGFRHMWARSSCYKNIKIYTKK
ncbi:hypothetical protein PDESU_02612 [Pontiella desulfatans]|uniref:3-keto-disaccharide hydrolase domain-containing protein n=1 Tax=Pontiella desulfatans TaxID=2750659 RepID=A0A6C2U2I6_PONDE|nr:DUF1961 family protein [Pontiella desulfatans]VGO14055.1 hypothetical protein PDESU_02612 [Pontiella desulfatans]